VIARGGVYWVDLGAPRRSRPGKRRPALVIQSSSYNDSRLSTVIVAAITSNTAVAIMPGNVFLPAAASGLPRDSVVNITALATVNKAELTDQTGTLPAATMESVDRGLRRVLAR
jgi:mRNA interferase MazF